MKIFPIACVFCLGLILSISCKQKTVYQKIVGETMGTYYAISTDREGVDIRSEVEKLLYDINIELSTYIDNSYVSKVNQGIDSICFVRDGEKTWPKHFHKNMLAAMDIYNKTNGAFDPTVMPLVNYWGFGYTDKKLPDNIDSIAVDSLNMLIGFDKVAYQKLGDSYCIYKRFPKIQLDFSAIAKGYAVDTIALKLESMGIMNYLVDIGGELRAKGVNKEGNKWTIGINTPSEDAQLTDMVKEVQISGKAMATSGNYRNFHDKDGVKYSHTINPLTGWPERSSLLSVSIIADDCMTADALATACMVLGSIKAASLINSLSGVEACFIVNDNGNFSIKTTDSFDVIGISDSK